MKSNPNTIFSPSLTLFWSKSSNTISILLSSYLPKDTASWSTSKPVLTNPAMPKPQRPWQTSLPLHPRKHQRQQANIVLICRRPRCPRCSAIPRLLRFHRRLGPNSQDSQCHPLLADRECRQRRVLHLLLRRHHRSSHQRGQSPPLVLISRTSINLPQVSSLPLHPTVLSPHTQFLVPQKCSIVSGCLASCAVKVSKCCPQVIFSSLELALIYSSTRKRGKGKLCCFAKVI